MVCPLLFHQRNRGLSPIIPFLYSPFVKEKDVQTKFVVGFLIPFPFAVLALFFGTLWHNHTLFYAPKDYQSDQAFQDVWEKGRSQQVDLVGLQIIVQEAIESKDPKNLEKAQSIISDLIQTNSDKVLTETPDVTSQGYFAYSDTYFEGEREKAIEKAEERQRALGEDRGISVYVFKRTYGTERWAVVFGQPGSKTAIQKRLNESAIPLYMNTAAGWVKDFQAELK